MDATRQRRVPQARTILWLHRDRLPPKNASSREVAESLPHGS
jgi:hypothetical protein